MDPKELKEFLESLKETDIEELNLESNDTQLSFKRDNVPSVPLNPGSVAGNGRDKDNPGAEKKKEFVPIKSPMVGTFYYSDSSDRPPFIIEGNHVTPGQKVGIIEAMKIMKEVNTNVKGKIVKVLVENGQAVEYGQPLFLADPEDIK
jgi:acetyl-CoA carboxylase biotin carboxyl carrier protein